MNTSRQSARRRAGHIVGVVSICVGAVLGLSTATASAAPVTFNGFVATGDNSFSSGGDLKPNCPEGILATPGSDPAAKRLGEGFDPDTFEPGDLIPYLYTDFTTAEESTFKLQDCVVSFPEDFFVAGDFTDYQLTNESFSKNDLAKAATELDAAELLDFQNTTDEGEDFTYSWQSPENLDEGLWICNIARDVAVNHGNGGDSDEVGNRKVSPVCFQVPGGGPEPGNGITVVKTNDANDDGVFHDEETAPGAGADVDFMFTITNDGEQTVTIDEITDAWPGHDAAAIEGLVCEGEDEGEIRIAAVLELPFDIDPGDTVTCTFSVEDYSAAAGGSVTNTVDVSGDAGETPVGDDDTSVVNTPGNNGCQRNCGGGGGGNNDPDPVDQCANIAGVQTSVPAGLYYGPGGECLQAEVLALTAEPEPVIEPEVLPEVLTAPEPAPVLPFTGNDNGLRLAAVATALMTLGGVLVLSARRRVTAD